MLTDYRFRPGWAATVATVLVLPALVGLGMWQLDRAEQKTAIRDRHLARGAMPPVDANRTALDAAGMDFRRATARGEYRADLTIYLDNKVLNGRPGYEVLTPLGLAGEPDRHLLVNRGWVPWGEETRSLPDIDTPSGPVSVSGRLRAPPQDYFTLEDETAAARFRQRWQNLDLERYAGAAGLSVSPLVLQLDPGARNAGGFARQWPVYDDAWIERHRAYAVQWFAMAVILVGLYVFLNLNNRKPDHG